MNFCTDCLNNKCQYQGSETEACDYIVRAVIPNIDGDPYSHHLLANEIADLLDKKRADYGAENIKKFGSQGVLVRVSDKVERLINLSRKEGQANFESVEDTWKDIAGYAILALIELREGR